MGTPSPIADGRSSAGFVRRVDDRLMFVIMAGLLFVVGFVSLAKQTDTVVAAPAPQGAVVAQKALQFADEFDGSVHVIDVNSGTLVNVFASGDGSFVRGVLRSLVRARNARGLTQASAFDLALYEDGRMILSDPETHEAVDLVAFGATNFRAFSQLLDEQ